MPLNFYRGELSGSEHHVVNWSDYEFLYKWLIYGGSEDNLTVYSPDGIEYSISNIDIGDININGRIDYSDLQYLQHWLNLGGSIDTNKRIISVVNNDGIKYSIEAVYGEPEPEPEPEPEAYTYIVFYPEYYTINIDDINKLGMELTINAPQIFNEDDLVDSRSDWSYKLGAKSHNDHNNWVNINNDFTGFFYAGETTITWYVFNKYGERTEAYVTINVTDVFGPKIGNIEHDFIDNYEFVINSHTNIYSGQINVPNVYDEVDGYLDKIKYKVNQYGEWIEIDTTPEGDILNLDFKQNTTIIYWNAVDNAGHESINHNNDRTIVIVRDNHGPYLENFNDDITVHSNEVNTILYGDRIDEVEFKITDNKNTFNGPISIPKAYDAVDNWLTRVYYKIDVSGQWESIPVWPGELILDWPFGETVVYWKATDYNDNDSINSVITKVKVVDSYGPVFVNADSGSMDSTDPNLNINNFLSSSITSFTKYKTLSIPLPKAYDAVDGEINTYEYSITGGTTRPQSGVYSKSDGEYIYIEFQLKWQNYIDDGSGSIYQEFIIDWNCKDSDSNYAQNNSTTTIQIKDEYGPILFFHFEDYHISIDINTYKDGSDASYLQEISTEYSKNYATLGIKRPTVYDNVYGQIHDLTFSVEPSENVNSSTGNVAYGSPGPFLKFSLDPHKIVPNTNYQEFTINWHAIDKSNNSPANTCVTYVRLMDNEIPNFLDSSGSYLTIETVTGELGENENSIILTISRPRVADAVDINKYGDEDNWDIEFVINTGTGDAKPIDASGVDVSGGILSVPSMQVEFVLDQNSIVEGERYMVFSITWTVTDTAGNKVDAIQDVLVYNNAKPYIIGSLPPIYKNTDNDNPVHIKIPRPQVGDNVDINIKTLYRFVKGDGYVLDGSGGELPGQLITNINYTYDEYDVSGVDMFFYLIKDEIDLSGNNQEYIIEWQAVNSSNFVSDAQQQKIIITDNTGPYFDEESALNSSSDTTEFYLNSHTNQKLITIPLPKAYDAVDKDINDFRFDVSGGIANPQNGSVSSSDSLLNIDILFTIETHLLYSDQTNPKYQTFTIQWYCNDICGLEAENELVTNIKIYDNYGPLIGGVSEDYIIDELYSFVDESYEYTGQISIPNVYDAVDGWLNNISYRKYVNNVLEREFGVQTDSSGTMILEETWVEGVTEYEWMANDYASNNNENTVKTRVTIIDERPANISEEEVWFNKFHQNNDKPNFQNTYPSIHDRYDVSGSYWQYYFWETNIYDPTKVVDPSDTYMNTNTDYDNVLTNPNGQVAILGNWINYRNYIPNGYYENDLPEYWSNYNTEASNSQGCIAVIVYSFEPEDSDWKNNISENGKILWMMGLENENGFGDNSISLSLVYNGAFDAFASDGTVTNYPACAKPIICINGTTIEYPFIIEQDNSNIYDWMIVFNWIGNTGNINIDCELNMYKRVPANSPNNPNTYALEWNSHPSTNDSMIETNSVLYSEWEKIWKAGYENGEQVEWDKRSLYIGGHSSTLSEHNNTKWNKFKLRLAMFREKQD